MRFKHLRPASCALIATFGLAGCGTVVPHMGELWEDNSGKTPHDLELKIKNKAFCELQSAVAWINDPTKREPFEYVDLAGKKHPVKPLPDSWGVLMTLNLTVIENTALNPGVTLNTPIVPATVRFPGNITSSAAQSYSFGLGGTLSSEATRIDKYSFYYLIKDLEKPRDDCGPDAFEPEDLEGSSFLLTRNLGVYEWLNNAMNIRASRGISAPSKQEVFSYDVKFNVVSSGNITPSWKLVRITTGNGGANLFSTKRDRTHEMTIVFGPTDTSTPKKSPPQPGLLASNEALARQIGSAVETGVRNALSVPAP